MHVTRCRIADRFRRRQPQNVPLAVPRADTTADSALNLRDPSAEVLDGIWARRVAEEHCGCGDGAYRNRANPSITIFHLHAVKGLGVRDVAKLTGASLPKVCNPPSHREVGEG
jgi:hypothetical protein